MKTIIAKRVWLDDSDLRLDASFHLSETNKIKQLYKKSPYSFSTIEQQAEKVYSGKIFKRTYVSDPSNGIPYITGSDMIKSDINSGKYLSKKQSAGLKDLLIKKGWILVTCSGTLGNVVYTNKLFENRIATHDLIRIIPNNKDVKEGFLYAYLSSNYGYSLLTQSSYGGVVKHIEPHHIANIPIPIFPPEKQQQINDLITQSAELRVEGNRLLEEAVKLFEKNLPQIPIDKTFSTSINTITRNNLRLDSTTNYANIQAFYKQVSLEYKLRSIESLSAKVFTPNIFKRIRVKNPDLGLPFLSGSDLLDSLPKFESYLSKKMRNLNDYILKYGWIAIQDSGTIGYISIINGFLDGVTATNNLVRIVPKKNDNANPYIFTFLKTKQGQQILKGFEYGSVQKHIDNYQVSSLLIPIIPDYKAITDSVSHHLEMVTESCNKENQAIQLVEKEIEQWQQ